MLHGCGAVPVKETNDVFTFSHHFKRMTDLKHLISLLHSTHNVYLFHAKLVLQNEAIVSQHEAVSYIAAPISQYNYLAIMN